MAESRFIIEPFDRQHDRTAFSCGEETLDRYIKQFARQDVERSLAAVFVLLDTQTGRIAGFCTLSALSIEFDAFPPDIARRLPRYPIPTTLIGRLAVDSSLQGQRLGRALLYDALRRAYHQRTQIGSMALIVDAKHEQARRFYERNDFRRFPTNPFRLYLTMQSIGLLMSAEAR